MAQRRRNRTRELDFRGNKNVKRKSHVPRGVRIIFEDDDVIVFEKAVGLLSQSTRRGGEDSVESLLTDYVRKGQWKSRKCVHLVHRLDRETSGVMMVAKSEEVQEYFRSNWAETTSKTYLALVEGAPDGESGVFESHLVENDDFFVHSVKTPGAGKYARTEWRKISTSRRGLTLVKVSLKTGRKNQIRVHFREAGHPVVGDAKYGHGRRGDRLCLHSWRLSFIHPRTHEAMEFETPLPDFAKCR